MPVLDPKRNFGLVRLQANYDMTAAATSIDLETGDGSYLPAPASEGAFNLTIWRTNVDVTGSADSSGFANAAEDPNREVLRITARSADTLTIARAQEGTTASSHNETDARYMLVLSYTKKDRDDTEAKFDSLDDDIDGMARSKFLAYLSGSQNIAASSPETVEFDTVSFDTNGDFSVTQFGWVAPRDSYMHFDAQVYWDGYADQTLAALRINNNGSAIAYDGTNGSGTGPVSNKVSVLASVSADDLLTVSVYNYSGSAHNLLSPAYDTFFCGYEVQKI